MTTTTSVLRRLDRLEAQKANRRTVYEMSDAELLAIAGLPPDATTAQIEAMARSGPEGKKAAQAVQEQTP